MKWLRYWVVLLCCLPGIAGSAQTIIEAGEVSGIWDKHGSPYIVTGRINIPVGSALEIRPGVTVIFNGHYKFEVMGRLHALGSVTDSIVFTAADTVHGWHGLRFLNTVNAEQDTSRLSYCRIEYGRVYGDCPDNRGGAIYAELATLSVTHCLIRRNKAVSGAADWGGGAIFCEKTNALISNNRITANYSGHDGGGIYCSMSNSRIVRNIIEGNRAAFRGGGIAVFTFSSPFILNNVIRNNAAADHGGGINISGGNPLIQHNYIEENLAGTGGGGICCYLSNARIINNQIVLNEASYGGGLSIRGCSPYILANTICSNQASGNGGAISNTFEMIGVPVTSNPILTSNIIYYNTAAQGSQVWSAAGCVSEISYCAIQEPYGDGISGGMNDLGGNTGLEPLFLNIGENPWSLNAGSPCVDAGPAVLSGTMWPECDLGGCERVWDGNGDQTAVIDIGAWEFGSQPLGISEANPQKKKTFTCFICPNPAPGEVTFIINTPQPGEVIIRLIQSDGRILLNRPAYVSDDDHKEMIRLHRLPTGVYIYEVYFMGKRLSGRIAHL